MTQIGKLETDRLLLRQWQPADREPFAQLNADPQVMEFFPELLSREASDAMADEIQALIEQQGWDLWAVEIKNTQQFIGYVGLHIPNYLLPFSPCVEIGWRLAHEFWGNGYAPEAAKLVLKFGFRALHLPEIVSFTTLSNLRSQRVMEKIGMHRSPGTFQHPKVPIESPLGKHCLYRLSISDWLQQTVDKDC